LYKSTIEKHNNTIKLNTLIEQVTYILFTLREMLEIKPILVHFTTKNNTSPGIAYSTTKNDTSLRITDFTNENATESTTQIVQILLTKTLKIELIKVNENN